MLRIEDVWPVYALRITVGPLELTPVRDDDIPALVSLAQHGIHDPAEMPFFFPWTDAPAHELPANMAKHYWESRAAFRPEEWGLELVVRRADEVLGIQAFATHHFGVTRTGETGSWLGRDHQGQGVGTLMRQAVCALAFDHLGAEEITSGAFTENPASMAVSRKVGYRDNGRTREKRRGEPAVCRRLVLEPNTFVRAEHDLSVQGLPEFRRMIGLDS